MTSSPGSSVAEVLSVGGVELEVLRRGSGRPMLLLHGFQNVDPRAPFLDALGRHAEIIAPSHPGFGHSARPDGFDTVYDLVHLYLDVLEALPHDKVTLVGLSFGGWLAAEVAVKCGHRLDRLVLVDALGIKVSGRETPDILDLFNTSPQEVQRRSWHDPAAWAPNFDAMSDDQIVVRARNWETLCLYGWHPYMYNPQLGTGSAASRCRPSCSGARAIDRVTLVWTGVQPGDSGIALRADRAGGAPPGDRAARRIRAARGGVRESIAAGRREPWTRGFTTRIPIPSCRRTCSTARIPSAPACRTATATPGSPPTCSRRRSTSSCCAMTWG